MQKYGISGKHNETLLCDISTYWKWLGTSHKSIVTLMQRSRVVLWAKKQLAMSEIKDAH